MLSVTQKSGSQQRKNGKKICFIKIDFWVWQTKTLKTKENDKLRKIFGDHIMVLELINLLLYKVLYKLITQRPATRWKVLSTGRYSLQTILNGPFKMDKMSHPTLSKKRHANVKYILRYGLHIRLAKFQQCGNSLCW